MPKKCYYKPNRSKPRVFKTCDVARIAENARRDGSQRADIIATAGFRLGYYKLVDGSAFTEGEVKNEIRSVLETAGFISDIAAVIPVTGIYGILLSLAVKFASVTAGVIAPIVLVLLERHTIVGVQDCRNRNGKIT